MHYIYSCILFIVYLLIFVFVKMIKSFQLFDLFATKNNSLFLQLFWIFQSRSISTRFWIAETLLIIQMNLYYYIKIQKGSTFLSSKLQNLIKLPPFVFFQKKLTKTENAQIHPVMLFLIEILTFNCFSYDFLK